MKKYKSAKIPYFNYANGDEGIYVASVKEIKEVIKSLSRSDKEFALLSNKEKYNQAVDEIEFSLEYGDEINRLIEKDD